MWRQWFITDSPLLDRNVVNQSTFASVLSDALPLAPVDAVDVGRDLPRHAAPVAFLGYTRNCAWWNHRHAFVFVLL